MNYLSYKTFVWPQNPHTYKEELVREPKYYTQDGVTYFDKMGDLQRTITGSGVFYGEGAYDSYKALIIPAMFSGFGIFMMKQHIATIPDEILEAARIDGANEFYIFHRIIFPMAKNGISSIAIFQFLWAWEDYLWPYLVINTQEKQLLSVGLKMFNGQYSTDYGALFAATAISIIPVLLIYLFFQKQFIAGIAASAVKG